MICNYYTLVAAFSTQISSMITKMNENHAIIEAFMIKVMDRLTEVEVRLLGLETNIKRTIIQPGRIPKKYNFFPLKTLEDINDVMAKIAKEKNAKTFVVIYLFAHFYKYRNNNVIFYFTDEYNQKGRLGQTITIEKNSIG